MVSEQAKLAIAAIFDGAARSTLGASPDDRIDIEPLAGPPVRPPAGALLVLTLVSYTYRLLVILHVEDEAGCAAHFARGASGNVAELLAERGNLCCGAMNRELGRYFLHTGMSTPDRLEAQCLAFLEELGPTHVARRRVLVNGRELLGATLCLCAFAPIDFRHDATAEVAATGELELF